jgi:hypothetical protein
MILYIHGFGSHGEGSKAKILRKFFQQNGTKFFAPSLSYIPDLAVGTLQEFLDTCHEDVSLIGSSLGGYYAMYLSEHPKVKNVVLINPSVYPYITLQKVLGNAPSFYDTSSFTWLPSHLTMLKAFKQKSIDISKFLLLTQMGDELLDYKEAVRKLQGATVVVEEGGNHGFVGIERHFETLKEFLSKK